MAIQGLGVNAGARFSRAVSAGRRFSWYWPDQATLLNGASGAVVSNGGVQRTAGFGTAGTGTRATNVISGVTCQMIRCFAINDQSFYTFDPIMIVNPRIGRGAPIPSQCDDIGVWRFVANLAAVGPYPSAITSDYGFEIVKNNNGPVFLLKDANPGYGVRLLDAGHAELLIQGPNGLIRQSFALDVTKFHSYEFVIASATPFSEATFTFLIDGVVQALPPASQTWAAGTNLPAPTFLAGRVGFYPVLVNFGQVASDNSVLAQSILLAAGQTYADTL